MSEEILRRALELSDEDRASLALLLMDSLSPPDRRDPDEWLEAIERRAQRALGGGGGDPFDEAVARIERDLKL